MLSVTSLTYMLAAAALVTGIGIGWGIHAALKRRPLPLIPQTYPTPNRPDDLSRVQQPVLVANGDSDKMVPSSNSVDLARRLPNAELVLYSDAGHGGIFQYHEAFVKKALEFLES